jgi:hypothetical protein
MIYIISQTVPRALRGSLFADLKQLVPSSGEDTQFCSPWTNPFRADIVVYFLRPDT